MTPSMISIAIVVLSIAGIGAAVGCHTHRNSERDRVLSNAFDRARWRRMHGVSYSVPRLEHLS